MFKYIIAYIVALNISLQLFAAEDYPEINRRIQIRNDMNLSGFVNVVITDVPGDGDCAFHSTSISRSKFYSRLNQLAHRQTDIIDAIMGSFRRPCEEYRNELERWFSRAQAAEKSKKPRKIWLNTEGLHLLSVLFNIPITTYSYAYSRSERSENRNIFVVRSQFVPLASVDSILLNEDFVISSLAPSHILNVNSNHWNRISFSQMNNLVEIESSESEAELENGKDKVKEDSTASVRKETKKRKRSESEEGSDGQPQQKKAKIAQEIKEEVEEAQYESEGADDDSNSIENPEIELAQPSYFGVFGAMCTFALNLFGLGNPKG